MPPLTSPVVAPGVLGGTAQPVLIAGELTLRPWGPADVPVLVSAYSEPEIQQWHSRSLEGAEAEAWIGSRVEQWEQERSADWAIVDDSGVIGRIGLRRIELADGLAEVAYWVLPHARGRRVAARALCALSDWLFGSVGLHRIELMHSTQNPGSCRVAELASFRLEGVKRQETLHPDGWHDMHLHARLADDSVAATDERA